MLARALATGRLAIRDALAELDVAVVELDPARLANANTPAELASLLDASPAERRAGIVSARVVSPAEPRRGRRDERSSDGRGLAVAGEAEIGGGLVIAGLVVWLVLGWFWIGVIVVLLGLVAFGGFVRGKWY